MANLWLDTFLGNAGKYLIRFIDSYYFYLVPIIVVYGLFLTISSYNLKRIEKKVISEITGQARQILKGNPAVSYTDLTGEITIDWEAIIKKSSFFPFISTESGFWVNRTNIFNVRETIINDERKVRLFLERNGIFLEKDRNVPRKNLYMEYFHRITKR